MSSDESFSQLNAKPTESGSLNDSHFCLNPTFHTIYLEFDSGIIQRSKYDQNIKYSFNSCFRDHFLCNGIVVSCSKAHEPQFSQ